ncbi:hypothetical protein D3H65_20220 [Paraflavitalea soli]|uniref:Uncharacterized protein n=1 Tax=Paraflavitalea soli TaxID=2315862 RepID=A0A3B7N195_9BACT|nr:hypothetical protein [Paraflavitalea soli]AXY76171.1 hypothetical protein D3H65_20220 [Paraflavitalea soli]
MESTFYIQFNVKTQEGLQSYGRFDIGNDSEAAAKIFHQLKGSPDVNEHNFLSLELMETVKGLPVNLQIISCTLDELAYNCRVISKEVFNQANIKLP